jgi:hypothetical protein
MRTHLNVIDGKGETKKLELFSSKSDSGVRVIVRTKQSADPIALDKAHEPLGHVVAPDQEALWQELMGHPKRIKYTPNYDFTLPAGITGEAIWFNLDCA